MKSLAFLLLSFCLVVVVALTGCDRKNAKSISPELQVVRVDASYDSIYWYPLQLFTYDDDGQLIQSVSTQYLNNKLIHKSEIKYTHSHNKVFAEGVYSEYDTITGEPSTTSPIIVKLEFDKENQIRKTTDFANVMNSDIPLVNEFVWHDGRITHTLQYFDSRLKNGTYRLETDYLYKDNLVYRAITKLNMTIDERLITSNDTLDVEYTILPETRPNINLHEFLLSGKNVDIPNYVTSISCQYASIRSSNNRMHLVRYDTKADTVIEKSTGQWIINILSTRFGILNRVETSSGQVESHMSVRGETNFDTNESRNVYLRYYYKSNVINN